MYCHDLERMSSNPGWIKLEVHSTSVLNPVLSLSVQISLFTAQLNQYRQISIAYYIAQNSLHSPSRGLIFLTSHSITHKTERICVTFLLSYTAKTQTGHKLVADKLILILILISHEKLGYTRPVLEISQLNLEKWSSEILPDAQSILGNLAGISV